MTDLLVSVEGKENVVDPKLWSGKDEVGSGGDPAVPKVEVWGLTAWYLNVFMRWLKVY